MLSLVLWHWPHFLEPISSLWYPESGRLYAFGSSWGGDTALLGVAGVAVHHVNCHEHGCWRPGKHSFRDPDTHEIHRLCSKHHPQAQHKEHWWNVRKVHSPGHVKRAYMRAQEKQ